MASGSSSGVFEGEGVGSSSIAAGVNVTPPSGASSTWGSSVAASGSTLAILQRLEDDLRRTATIIGQGVGRYHDMLPFVEECIEELRRVGGLQLVRGCERELQHLEGLIYCLEELAHADPDPAPLSMSALLEREALAKRIQKQEALLRRLHKQHHAVLAKMDAYVDTASFVDAGSLEGEAKLKRLERENMWVSRAAEAEARALQLLCHEEENGEATIARLRQWQEERARARREAELADVKAKIATFSLLKLM